MKVSRFLCVAFLLTVVSGAIAVQAHAEAIDFTALPSDTAVTNQFAGVTFSLAGGNDPNGAPTTTYFQQGTSTGGLTDTRYGGNYPTAEFLVATFSAPVSGVSFSFFDAGFNGGNSYALLNASGGVIASGLMSEASFSSYTYNLPSTGVSSIEWGNGHPPGGNWWQDIQHLSFNPVNSVPEPSILLLFGTGLAGVGVMRRKLRV